LRRQAEIDHPHMPAFVDEDVRRLEVAVYDAVTVQVSQRLQQFDQVLRFDTVISPLTGGNDILRIVDEGHREEGAFVVVEAEIEHAHDVWMVERGESLKLTGERD